MTRTGNTGRFNDNWLLIPLVVVLVMGYWGYTVGKDLAMRDNAREAAALERTDNR